MSETRINSHLDQSSIHSNQNQNNATYNQHISKHKPKPNDSPVKLRDTTNGDIDNTAMRRTQSLPRNFKKELTQTSDIERFPWIPDRIEMSLSSKLIPSNQGVLSSKSLTSCNASDSQSRLPYLLCRPTASSPVIRHRQPTLILPRPGSCMTYYQEMDKLFPPQQASPAGLKSLRYSSITSKACGQGHQLTEV